MNRSLRITVFLLLGLTACRGPAPRSDVGSGKDEAVSAYAAAQTITADEMRARIAYLASDELRGRDTPSPGLELAAAYLAREFAAMGLAPAGDDGGFIQRYPYPLQVVSTQDVRLELGKRRLEYGSDFFAVPGSAGRVAAPVMFVGTGIEEGAGGATALSGRVAAVYLPGVPPGGEWQSTVSAAQESAQSAGAVGVVFILEPTFTERSVAQVAAYVERPQRALGGQARIPSFFVRYAAVQEAFRGAGRSLDALREEAVAGPMRPLELAGVRALLAAATRVVEDARPPNVVAVLRGADPVLRDEYVVFSAHMDHVGVGRADEHGDSIYNGADDDASGTAAILEIAQAFAAVKPAPARSIIFLAVSGEEKGLLGSRYFTEHPPVPLESIVANLNLDMIARNAPDTIHAIGLDYSSLGAIAKSVAERHAGLGLTVAPDRWPQEQLFFRSDHFNFASQGVPALFLFAGLHEDYHRPSDEPDGVDASKAARVARLGFLTGYEVATRRAPPRWTDQGMAEVRAARN